MNLLLRLSLLRLSLLRLSLFWDIKMEWSSYFRDSLFESSLVFYTLIKNMQRSIQVGKLRLGNFSKCFDMTLSELVCE